MRCLWGNWKIHRYRQIIETEGIEKLNTSGQENLSQDQKHTSAVAKIHYQKCKPENIAVKAKKTMDKLRDKNESSSAINLINSDTESSASNNASLGSNHSTKAGTFSVNSIRIKKVPFSEMEDSFFMVWQNWLVFPSIVIISFILLGRLVY